MALCSNDAKSYYNRIVLLIVALGMCHLGAKKNWSMSMIETLANMNHHIQMAYRESKKEQNWKHWKALIAGIGQGNGAGLAIWTAISTPLFNIMEDDGYFALIICAIS